MRGSQFCVPVKPVVRIIDRARPGAWGPLLEQNLHRRSVTAHHIRVSLELRFLGGSDLKLFVKLRYPRVDELGCTAQMMCWCTAMLLNCRTVHGSLENRSTKARPLLLPV